MGLFDIFKKKRDSNPSNKHVQYKCSQCLRPIEGHAWSIDNKYYTGL
mgnify:CR=1 FL=1